MTVRTYPESACEGTTEVRSVVIGVSPSDPHNPSGMPHRVAQAARDGWGAYKEALDFFDRFTLQTTPLSNCDYYTDSTLHDSLAQRNTCNRGCVDQATAGLPMDPGCVKVRSAVIFAALTIVAILALLVLTKASAFS